MHGYKVGPGFFTFSDAPPPDKKVFFMFLAVNAKLTPLGNVIGMYLVIIIPLCYWSVQQALASHWLDKCAHSTPTSLAIDQSHAALD
jgi:hypothetical protein